MHLLADSSTNGTGSAVAAVVFSVIGVGLYCVPLIVALIRRLPNRGSVIVINVFLGWTLIGWIIALAMAVRGQPRPQYVVPSGWQPPQDVDRQGGRG